jgi:purine-nucleoside phosphorylase
LQLAGRPLAKPEVQVVSHEEVLLAGKAKGEVMKQLVERIITLIN